MFVMVLAIRRSLGGHCDHGDCNLIASPVAFLWRKTGQLVLVLMVFFFGFVLFFSLHTGTGLITGLLS